MAIEVEDARQEDTSRRARRLVDLKVDEVSVVDSPAIQREFLIVKRLEDGNMGVFDKSEPQEPTEVTKAEIDASEAEITKAFTALGWQFGDTPTTEALEKQLPDDLKSALQTVIPMMRAMAGKAADAEKAALMRVAAFLSNVQNGRLPLPQGGAKPNGSSAPKGPDAGKEAAKDKEKKAEQKKVDEKKEKALSLDGTEAAAFIQVDEDGQLHFVTKGGKAFTGRRTQALTEASAKLLEMLKEVDEEAFKRTVSQLVGKELPKDVSVESEVRPTPTQKSAGGNDEPPAWAADIVKQLSAQNDRLEAIEKARSPSTSVDGAGGTDDPTKVEKSFWHGVL